MTDNEKAALCARIDELCAEVERLRQENQSVGMAAYELGRKSMADESAKLTNLAKWMYQVMDESCAVRYPYSPAPVSMQALIRAEKELRALGIEVD